jgi:single-stranded-DNA-specific exonuclease
MEKIWQIHPRISDEFREKYKDHESLVLQILHNRGIKEEDDLKWFLSSDQLDFLSPFLFRDMEKAVDLIISHIKKENKIMIYGDYDADGVTASALLYDVLKTFKANVAFYLPDRSSEGYGLNVEAIDQIKEDGYGLIITVDNGIRNKEEVDYAKKKGLDVIITDHHAYPEKPEDLPDCLIINSSDPSSAYPFEFLAGVGVAFKLASALIERSKLNENDKKILLERNLDLVAIGTVADMVPLIGENRLLVERGLKVLNKTKKLGLLELMEVSAINGELGSFNLGFQLGPRLNAASRIKHANTALELLISKDKNEARILAEDLNDKNKERQEITKKVLLEAESQVDEDDLPEIIVVKDFSEDPWNEGVVGLVSGRLKDKYYRPSLVVVATSEKAEGEDVYKGSGRSIEGFSLVEALEESKDLLYKYGGHPMAGGFSILSKENALKFIDRMKELAKEKLDEKDLQPKLKIDAEINFEDINDDLVEKILSLAPFGQKNPSPRFASFNVKIIDIFKMGSEGQHIKIKFLNHNDKDMKSLEGISFSDSEKYAGFKVGDNVDIAYSLDFNIFNGRKNIQLKIIDIKKYD